MNIKIFDIPAICSEEAAFLQTIMKRTNKTLILTFVLSVIIVAQGFAQTLSVEGIRALPNDLSASVYQRNDYNGTPCALIKVAFPKVGAAFEGNVVGKTEYKAGEYWVYMTANSKYLKLKHAEYSPLMIQFDDNTVGPVESKRVYGVKVSAGAAKQPVTFKITPSNAILTVDQKECATTNGIAEIMLSPEEHTYVVVAQGYKTQGSKFMVYENNTNKIIVELDPKGTTTSVPSVTPMVEQCEYGELTIDGGKYVGEYKNGKPHGRGIIYFSSGDEYKRKSYDGDWVNGIREGTGTMVWNSGEKYVGQWKDGVRNGYGTDYYVSGDIYEGNWLSDKRHGKGTYIWQNGEKYVGQWKDGVRNGYGTDYYVSGDIYEGNWLSDKRHGKGTYIWQNGEKYVGQWEDGVRNGKGKITYAPNDSYNRKYYDGDWVNGNRQGMGTMVWNSGEKYVGQWKDGVRNGYGTNYFASGDKEVANYSEGKKNGIGTYYSVDGWYEKGNYIDGKEDGEHERYDENGKHIATRTYIKGKLIRTKYYD